MSIFIFSLAITIIITAIAAYFDTKKGIIPNKLTISLLLFGIGINTIFSVIYNNNSYIFNSVILTLFIFLLTYILWKFKVWAGGDVKLFTAIASSISNSPNLFEFQLFGFYFPKIAIYPFPLTVIFNSILISFPFLILFLLLKNYKIDKEKIVKYKGKINFFNIFKQFNSKKRIILKNSLYSMIFSILFIIFTGIYKNIYNLIYLLSFGVILSLIASFLFKPMIKNFKIFVKNSSSKRIAIFKLNEGMIIDKTYFTIDTTYSNNFDELLNTININESNLDIKKIATKKGENKQTQYFLNSSTAAGLTIYDISFIKSLFKMKIIDKNIQIKIGIPFAPSIAIGLIIAIFIGDLSVLIINILNNFLNYLQFL